MGDKLNIAVACGGTGGHIFPGLATARVLMERGHNVSLWLTGKSVEDAALKGWKGRVVTVPAEGFQFGAFRSVLTALRMGGAVVHCWWNMRRHRPDIVLAMGSYASIGPCLAARLRGIPVVLHEANAVPGKAVRLLSGKARAIAICFEETRYHLKGLNLVPTGMPLRPELRKPGIGRQKPGFRLLVMGGSGGAHAINEIVSTAVCSLRDPAVHVTHLTGFQDADIVRKRYQQAGVDAEVHTFVQNMAPLYQNASLAVCRSGASTCAELGLFGVPALLIPYPHAAGDHQTANARALEKRGAADVIQQADMTDEWLKDYLTAQIENSERLEKMRRHASRNLSLNAAGKLAELVEQCAWK
ncbi:MAG: UDP-N-acetylglucosamine--N-acetylmuramyl-(pentapeptide) pyrophosphoryl-undecaprenol [Verrucomicrobiota bacterium]|jgi:UDP-N-acetylglucosamine--N-acetylmuramyl-(pentapeptide) pyrophosphoryl-undecaprenol N-acetylglucosamine transferase|nr:UDP-N-acetylglucosamine--N-acetylmuramyl-(pentapeptide) pyrophosphoryl-undecaprenol [Verrucomicrobiota bacterium]MDK2963508.1 UDP-N-acetylglucosamine--N-acetylmuramyl-(pentapeptide) pyrophosphoryl-undecaprenol [Verrucomicrobiota bacterium]